MGKYKFNYVPFRKLQEVLEDYIQEVKIRYQQELTNSDRYASGDLINNISYVTSFGEREFWVGLNLEEYWKYVEYDTRPHFPPIDAIKKWLTIKPTLPIPKNLTDKQVTSLAYAVATKIDREGTKGSHDLHDTLEKLNKEYEQKIVEAIDEDVWQNIDGVIKVLFL